MLLVLGVFLGIQVANWNEESHNRQNEREYLERLLVDLATILPLAKAEHQHLQEQAVLIEGLRSFLASGQGAEKLDERHCIAVGRSHIYAGTIFYPPTIKELISTGRILLIREPTVRAAIMSFDQTHTELTQLRTDIQIDRKVLARYYPELIDSGLSADWKGAVCDFEGMRSNPAFRNDFTDNMRRYRAYTAEIGQRQVRAVEALVTALDYSASGKSVQSTNAPHSKNEGAVK